MPRLWRTNRMDKDNGGAEYARCPVDAEPVFVIEGEGCDRFVLDDGAVIAGRIARPEEERPELPVAFVSHWKTCPNAGDFRRSRRG